MWWRVTLVTALLSVKCVGGVPYNDRATVQKLQLLQSLSNSASTHGVFQLSDDNYKSLFLQEKWPFFAVVAYQAPKNICGFCGVANEAMEHVSKLYLDSEMQMDSKGRILFFASINLSEYPEIAKLHKFESVPNIAVLTSETIQTSGAIAKNAMFEAAGAATYDDQLLDFVNKLSGKIIKTRKSWLGSIAYYMMLGVLFGVLLWTCWNLFFLVQSHAWMQAAAAVTIQWIASSGLCFNLIHGMVFYTLDNRRRPIYFHPNARSQFMGEGLACSGLAVLAGLMLVASILLPRWNWFTKKCASPNTAVVVCFALICQLYRLIFLAHHMKNPWISPTFFPGPEANRGSWRVDRGYA